MFFSPRSDVSFIPWTISPRPHRDRQKVVGCIYNLFTSGVQESLSLCSGGSWILIVHNFGVTFPNMISAVLDLPRMNEQPYIFVDRGQEGFRTHEPHQEDPEDRGQMVQEFQTHGVSRVEWWPYISRTSRLQCSACISANSFDKEDQCLRTRSVNRRRNWSCNTLPLEILKYMFVLNGKHLRQANYHHHHHHHQT